METLKYKVINSENQYYNYCNILEKLLESNVINNATQDEADLLTLLIEDWDSRNSKLTTDQNPIEFLQILMQENQLKAADLVKILGISKGLVSDILHYKKGLSKEVIRKLADHFKVSQEAFNKPYMLILKEYQTERDEISKVAEQNKNYSRSQD